MEEKGREGGSNGGRRVWGNAGFTGLGGFQF